VVEDEVEIGANTTVDRALLHTTRVGRGTKIDNLVMIAHNCRIGEDNIIIAHTAIAGSVITGKKVIIGGKVAIADHISIGDGATVVSGSNVVKNLEGGKTYGAALNAIEWSRWKRLLFYINRLPELFKGKR
jgi:UDP-3-O-[3-hydroxymyristoyl] glucosamine N-acyltransferase